MYYNESRDVHLHHWSQCDKRLNAFPMISYIKDTDEATAITIQYDSTLSRCSVINTV